MKQLYGKLVTVALRVKQWVHMMVQL